MIGSSITVLKREKFGLRHIESFIKDLPLNFKAKVDLIEKVLEYWLLRRDNPMQKEIVDDYPVIEVDLCWGSHRREEMVV